MNLKLGTRKSLLAWAQSSWVAREVERLNPGVGVELVGIETRGDRILDVPLSQVSGKEFFVAEIDEALASSRVDFTVHSMKDLSLERPAEFCLAAVPRRENPRDVLLVGPHALSRLEAGKPLRIGTSSPRRLENIPPFLERALPRLGTQEPKVELVEIRGNVNTRLSRVHEAQGSERYLDGVVLAFAGLIRLWNDEAAGRPELTRLLEGVRWMVLPLAPCPAAPAQGALAIECRANDARTRTALGQLHDAATVGHVARERELLARWGGGCHQRFGATAIAVAELGELFYVRGKKPDGEFVELLEWPAPPVELSGEPFWDGMSERAHWSRREALARREAGCSVLPGGGALFVAHWRALPDGFDAGPMRSGQFRVWTSGIGSWFALAERGVWVEGCAEGLGFGQLAPTLAVGVLRLPPLPEWTVLTHASGVKSWQGLGHAPRVVATYQMQRLAGSPEQAASLERLKAARHVFWGSASQFEELGRCARLDAVHGCAGGKSAEALRARGVKSLRVFPSVEEWRRWIQE